MDVTKVVRVYSGLRGCMCGCRGKYSESDRSKKIILNKILKNPNHKFEEDYVYVDTASRTLVAYFKDQN